MQHVGALSIGNNDMASTMKNNPMTCTVTFPFHTKNIWADPLHNLTLCVPRPLNTLDLWLPRIGPDVFRMKRERHSTRHPIVLHCRRYVIVSDGQCSDMLHLTWYLRGYRPNQIIFLHFCCILKSGSELILGSKFFLLHLQDQNNNVQIDIPTLLEVRRYGDRLLIVFDKGEIRRFIVVIYNSEVYTRAYYWWNTI
jgi:hypothetical protein